MLNWREIPFIRLLFPYMAGIVLSIFFPLKIPGLLPLTVLLAPLLYGAMMLRGWYQYRWLFGLLLNFFLLMFGYGITWHHNELNRPSHFSAKVLQPESIVSGRIADATIKKEKWVKFRLSVQQVGSSPDSLHACTGNVLVYLPKDSASEALCYGDLVAFQGYPTRVEPAQNPDAFDYSRYLHFQNIHHQVFIKNNAWHLVKKRTHFSWYGAAIDWQNTFAEILRHHLRTPAEISVGAALILGYREEVPEEILTAYSETGAVHILAVSGLHVGIIYILLNFFFKRIRRQDLGTRLAKAGIILALIWAFTFVTGASPSVLRAAVMFTIITLGTTFFRSKNFYNTLAASAFLLLLYDPFWVMSVSFQLSYLAVLGIVYFEQRFSKWWPIENKIGDYLWKLTCVSFAAQLMTLPYTMFYFHQFPMYFWLSSLVLVPLSAGVLVAGLALLPLHFCPVAGELLGDALYWTVWFCNQTVLVIQRFPVAVITGIWIGALTTLLLYLSLTGLMAALSFRRFRWAVFSLTLISVVFIGTAFTSYRHLETRQIVVYDIYKHTVIDFFDRKNVYSLTDGTLEKKALRFAAEGHRFRLGAAVMDTLCTGDSTQHTHEHWFFQNGMVQFYDKKIAFVRTPDMQKPIEKTKVDYVLLCNSPKIKIADVLETFDFQQIIIDASNKKWQVEKWRQECAEAGISCYDMLENGAWILDF